MLPPELARLARLHRDRQQVLVARVLRLLRRAWGLVESGDPQGSWAVVAPRVLIGVTALQAEAARGADRYVAAALTMTGQDPDPAGELVAHALAGVASDGRDMAGLLGYPAFEVTALADGGLDQAVALQAGGRHLQRIGATQIQDAARVATGVATAVHRGAGGYVRMLTPPSCSRCVILAGTFYRWNAGFTRHPHDDCVHVPAAEDHAGDFTTDPRVYFDGLTQAQRDRVFTAAGAQAIRDGADISQVVNARRGAAGLTPAGARLTEAEKHALRGGPVGRLRTIRVYGQDLYVTTEGVTTRGQAGIRLGARDTGRKTGRYRTARAPRLMPESIYQIAGDDRDEAIRLLRRFGYIT